MPIVDAVIVAAIVAAFVIFAGCSRGLVLAAALTIAWWDGLLSYGVLKLADVLTI